MVWTTQQIRARQRRNVSFLLALAGLVGVFGLVMTVHLTGSDIVPRFAAAIGLS